jgi:hypothetical protein
MELVKEGKGLGGLEGSAGTVGGGCWPYGVKQVTQGGCRGFGVLHGIIRVDLPGAPSMSDPSLSVRPLDWARWLFLGLISLLMMLSLWLALNRIYQVDEAQNTYMAWLMGTGQSHQAFVSAPAYLIPFAWLAKVATGPATLYIQLRLGFWILFWINLLLVVRGAGFQIRSRQGLIALLLIAMMPPFWTYGLEVRHENLIVFGVLLLWNLGRRPGRLENWSFLFMGAVAMFMQASAFKSIAYWVPITGAMLFSPQTLLMGGRRRAVIHWALGALVTLVVLAGLHIVMGTWSSFLSEQTGFLRSAGAVERFAPLSALSRLFFQTPLLMGVLLLPILKRFLGPFGGALDWTGSTAEFLLFLWSLVLLVVNPNPFPYNVLTIVAVGCLAAGAYLREVMPAVHLSHDVSVLLLGVVLTTQAVPFLVQTEVLLETDNSRQTVLMDRAADLTDPITDAVYDGAGLVPTRRSVGYYWFVNIMNVQRYRSGAIPTFRSEALRDAPAVILPTYRLSYLAPEDIQFIQANYLALAGDFLVLGDVSKDDDHSWTCLHAGRYEVMQSREAPRNAWLRLDGQAASAGVRFFTKGIHHIEASPGTTPRILWVGPKLDTSVSLQGGRPLQGIFPIPNAF